MQMNNDYKHIADGELLKRFQQDNDKKAFGILFKRYLPLLLGTCMRYLKSKEDAEDLVMELYEKSMKILKTNTEILRLKPFLFVVAKNAALGKLRTKKIMIEYQELVRIEIEEEVYNNFIIGNISEKDLNRAMDQLSENQRKCIELFYFKKMRYAEVSKALELSENAVKTNLQNGKRMLKMNLQKLTGHGKK